MLKREQTASAPMLKAWDRVDLGMFMEHKRVLQQSSLSTFHIISNWQWLRSGARRLSFSKQRLSTGNMLCRVK